MDRYLVLTVHLYGDGSGTARYHGMSQGSPEWPPAPGRVFQALVAGLACGNALPDHAVPAFEWLESLQPPIVAAPSRTLGQSVSLFVPNNDADSLSDPSDVSDIRTAKLVQPSLFSADPPLLYAWLLPEDAPHAEAIAASAHSLYQLGRGIDMAWACGEVIAEDALQILLTEYRGVVHRPEPGSRGRPVLACPQPGTLASLLQRHRATRLRTEGSGAKARVMFTNPPKPQLASVSYGPTRSLVVYELRDRMHAKPWPWSLYRAATLVERLRDAAAARLRACIDDDDDRIARCLVGRTPDGSCAVPVSRRIRIVPLASIGSVHADHAIRRVLICQPSGSELPAADVNWAFSGLDWIDPDSGELSPWIVTKSEADPMLAHYVGPSRRWRSVTAVALPVSARRRRIEPTRRQLEAKGGQERLSEEDVAVAAVRMALRHAEVPGRVLTIRVQREPFEAKGSRAEAFAEGTRFAKERLWHVDIELDRSVEGPLTIGDGRFLGLGVLAPVVEPWVGPAEKHPQPRTTLMSPSTDGFFALEFAGSAPARDAAPIGIARSLRRAVMARVRDALALDPDAGLDQFFSGHEPDGTSSRANSSRHLSFQWDPARGRLLVIAPHRLERRMAGWRELPLLQTLERALDGLVELRAGSAGCLGVRRASVAGSDPLLVSARRWISLTPYAVTRHRRCPSAGDALAADVRAECARCGLPMPEVRVIDARGVRGRGLEGRVQLDFSAAVAGPIALGRSSHLGGGLFAAADSADD